MSNIASFLRTRPATIVSVGALTGIFGYTYKYGPSNKDLVHKKVMAGLVASMTVEVGLHFVDTMNINAKVRIGSQDGKSSASLFNQFKSNMKGYQLAIHGSLCHAIFFFSLQEHLKLYTDRYFGNDQTDFTKSLNMACRSFVAEIIAICFYYPIDLTKSRIQVGEHHYHNLHDGLIKTFQEQPKPGITNLYQGCFWYSVAFTSFMTLDFAFENYFHNKIKKYVPQLSNLGIDELIAGFMSGSLAALLTNGFEAIAVNKQIHPQTFNLSKFLVPDPKLSTVAQLKYIIWLGSQGWKFRCIYYGLQFGALHFMLGHLETFLGYKEE